MDLRELGAALNKQTRARTRLDLMHMRMNGLLPKPDPKKTDDRYSNLSRDLKT